MTRGIQEMTFHENLKRLHAELQRSMKDNYNRAVSFGDLFTDRWERAKFYGFGEGTSVYDNVLILGDVKIGKNTWIGPNVVLDGTGGLQIGDYCSITAGVQIYTHNTVNWAISMGKEPAETKSTKIGSGVYIGPQTIIQMGSTIGDRAVIGTMSLIKGEIPDGAKAWGIPAKVAD